MINADLGEFFSTLGIKPTLSLCEFIWEGENGRIHEGKDYRCLCTVQLKIFYVEEKIDSALDQNLPLPISHIECVISEAPLSKGENSAFSGTSVWSSVLTPETRNDDQFIAGEEEDAAQFVLNSVDGLKLTFSGSHQSEDQE